MSYLVLMVDQNLLNFYSIFMLHIGLQSLFELCLLPLSRNFKTMQQIIPYLLLIILKLHPSIIKCSMHFASLMIPVNLLSSKQFGLLLHQLQSFYFFVIVDNCHPSGLLFV